MHLTFASFNLVIQFQQQLYMHIPCSRASIHVAAAPLLMEQRIFGDWQVSIISTLWNSWIPYKPWPKGHFIDLWANILHQTSDSVGIKQNFLLMKTSNRGRFLRTRFKQIQINFSYLYLLFLITHIMWFHSTLARNFSPDHVINIDFDSKRI